MKISDAGGGGGGGGGAAAADGRWRPWSPPGGKR